MGNTEQVRQVSSSPILWLLYGITIVISAIQTVLYMRQCSKTTRMVGLGPKIPKGAFRAGLISAIGPALDVFIVTIGLMVSIGDPMAQFRLSIVSTAATESSAADISAEACKATLGTEQCTLICLTVSWFIIALNDAGWLLFTGVATPSLEALRSKVFGGDMKWLVVLSGAYSLGISGYLNADEILKGMGSTLAVLTGAVSMVLLVRTAYREYPKLMEYSLGVAMIIGMIFALGYDQLLKQTGRENK